MSGAVCASCPCYSSRPARRSASASVRSCTCPGRRAASGTTAAETVSQHLSPALPPSSLPRHDTIYPSSESDEKFIVLIFENGLVEKEKSILGDILSEIGRGNNLSDFPTQLSFDEANLRLVNYNKASKQKEEKVGGASRGRAGTAHSNKLSVGCSNLFC